MHSNQSQYKQVTIGRIQQNASHHSRMCRLKPSSFSLLSSQIYTPSSSSIGYRFPSPSLRGELFPISAIFYSEKSLRHTGQLKCATHQESRQMVWNRCWQGVFLTSSLGSKFWRQMGQVSFSVCLPAASEGMKTSKWSKLAESSTVQPCSLKCPIHLRRLISRVSPETMDSTMMKTISPTMMQQQKLTPWTSRCQAVRLRIVLCWLSDSPRTSIQLSPLGCTPKCANFKMCVLHCDSNDSQTGWLSVLLGRYSSIVPFQTQTDSDTGTFSLSFSLQIVMVISMNYSSSMGFMKKNWRVQGLSSMSSGYCARESALVLQLPMKPGSQTQQFVSGLQPALAGQGWIRVQV